MFEIVLGLVVIVGVLAMLAGVGGMLPGSAGFDPLPLLGYGGICLLLAVGLLLIAAGFMRRAIARHSGETRHDLRTARLTYGGCLGAAALSLAVPLVAGPLNVVRIDGFPLGYYLAAQGALIWHVILAFAWAGRQNAIDAEGQSDE
ncbi:sodium/substrate symporter small subunit [Hyphomicrobium sp.]|uniref:DUF4212 domain-containing protein n=1 Tax=Hyphomicrobium sp. TaxID=82 RepID=UPI002E3743C5|nr:sodium/substrate symporter small subunit [Hyphomicrobium sp.]HEX2840255.1 sodium/substrate symporter small subunit [Hyphomicrobium sp.]